MHRVIVINKVYMCTEQKSGFQIKSPNDNKSPSFILAEKLCFAEVCMQHFLYSQMVLCDVITWLETE